ncbi:hypothetical protein [Hymenobacter properus]|uniref:Uncharacterized protein n=1 Tax=Hymenobacter properus TaxID=2791026 RepID=A0A931FLU5_9BACT|nr:hypothetical protein [Hymenobacter properus]MBF9143250.1 hypothetical protein [Hymenobacter properus]MBR7722060.1 hypothetical protein [Microvirga sp. SRT04]
MLYFPVFSLGYLALALLPPGTWTWRSALAVVAVLYGVVLMCARGSRLVAWQQKHIIGTEEIPSGFMRTDPSTFVPTYQGEQTWQWLLFGLPPLAWLCWHYVNRARNAPLRRALAALYLLYGGLVMYGAENDWFTDPGLSDKPQFRDEQLTIPFP